jgi:transposase-like protein
MLETKKQQKGVSRRGAERAVGERNVTAASVAAEAPVVDPELVERPRRRQFTAEYKLRILQEADSCTAPGQIGQLLRREGLYTSHLSDWRRQRDAGALAALQRPRGRRKPHPLEVENVRLRQRLGQAEAELVKARQVIEVQGNISALLGELLEAKGASGSESGAP